MNLLLHVKIAVIAVCLTSSVLVSAQSFEIPLGPGQIAPTIFSNPNNALLASGQDFITFAHQNDISLALDSNFEDIVFFNDTFGEVGVDITNFEVGSVTSNSQGGQNITFINGDLIITDGQGNIISDIDSDVLALLMDSTTVDVKTSNFSSAEGHLINVIGGTLMFDFLNAIDIMQDIAQIESEQTQSENTIRVTSSVVSGHLSGEIANAFGFDMSPGTELSLGSNKLSASSDANYAPDAFWGKHVYSSLTEDGSNLGYSTDLYQFIGGMDKRLGDFFFGSALSYVYGETNQAGNNSSSHTVGITPYVAYKINSFLFASALASYNYTGVNGTQGRKDADIHNYSGEVTLNAFKAIDDFIVKGRGGLRYTHNYTSLKGTIDADYDQLTWIGDVEFGYNINKQFHVFTGALYEYIDKESTVGTNRAAITGATHDGVVYFRSGFNYKVNDKLAVGFDASTDLNDEDNNILTFGANVRLAL